ncbi:MAG: hypothetical protein ABSH04_05715 [Acidimicrobiales bacterium]
MDASTVTVASADPAGTGGDTVRRPWTRNAARRRTMDTIRPRSNIGIPKSHLAQGSCAWSTHQSGSLARPSNFESAHSEAVAFPTWDIINSPDRHGGSTTHFG